MKLKEFLAFFDFDFQRYPEETETDNEDGIANGIGVIDQQGGNLGGIEGERFSSPEDVVARFQDSIYIPDYIDEVLEEDGYTGEDTWESQYEWCKANEHPYKDICYAFLHPETVEE